MGKIEVEKDKSVGDLRIKHKVLYEFEGSPDYTLLEFIPYLQEETSEVEQDAR